MVATDVPNSFQHILIPPGIALFLHAEDLFLWPIVVVTSGDSIGRERRLQGLRQVYPEVEFYNEV